MARKPQVHDEYIDSNQSTHCQTNVFFVCVCKHSLLPKGLIPVRYVIDSDASDTLILKCIQNIKSIFRLNSEGELTTLIQTKSIVFHMEREICTYLVTFSSLTGML